MKIHGHEHPVEVVSVRVTVACLEDGCDFIAGDLDPVVLDSDPIEFCRSVHPVRSDWVCEDFAGHLDLEEPRPHEFMVMGCERW